jgi:magnesium-protoporphyrin IX monomethyl ester (oxidative) cyclase
MRVCLVNPPRVQHKQCGVPNVFQPIDIAYVAAVLEKDHTVTVVDCLTEGWRNLQEAGGAAQYRLGLTNEQIISRFRQLEPDIVVIYCVPYSWWWHSAFELAQTVKAVNSEVKTVLVGLYPSIKPLEILSHPNIDFVVIGEPELTVQELVLTLEKGGSLGELKKVKGLGFNIEGKTIINPLRPFLEDIDSLPFPAWHLFPMKTFFEAISQKPMRGEINLPCALVLTSRGCPNNCIFCTNHMFRGKRWRGRSPENVISELEQLVEVYRIQQLDFEDYNLTFDRKRMIAICDLMVKHGLDLEWHTPNGIRADRLDAELLTKMRGCGCQHIMVAPESGVQRVVNQLMRKNQDLKKVEDAVVQAKKVGIKVGCFFILGFIGETKEEIQETIDFACRLKKLGADSVGFSYANPIIGTELYKQAKEGGYLLTSDDDDDLGWTHPQIVTPQFTAEELKELHAKARTVNNFLIG